MIFPSNRVRIMVATKPVDFRKGHDGLAAVDGEGRARALADVRILDVFEEDAIAHLVAAEHVRGLHRQRDEV